MTLNRNASRPAAVVAITALLAGTLYGTPYTWSAEPPAEPVSPSGYGSSKPLDEELLVPVSVWGEVENPGNYDVPDGTDAVGLISYAGGPTEFANLKRVKLVRNGAGSAYPLNVTRYLDTGDRDAFPLLQPGDTVYVSRNTKYAWTSFVEVISQLAVVATTVLLYVEVTRKDNNQP